MKTDITEYITMVIVFAAFGETSETRENSVRKIPLVIAAKRGGKDARET